MMKDRPAAIKRDLPLLPVCADHVFAQHAVEVHAELLRDHIEVVQVRE